METISIHQTVLDMIKNNSPLSTIVDRFDHLHEDGDVREYNLLLCFVVYHRHAVLTDSCLELYQAFSDYNPLVTALSVRNTAAIKCLLRNASIRLDARGYGVIDGDNLLLGSKMCSALDYLLRRDDDRMLSLIVFEMSKEACVDLNDLSELATRYIAGNCYSRFRSRLGSSEAYKPPLERLMSYVCCDNGQVTDVVHICALKLWIEQDPQRPRATDFLSQAERHVAEEKASSKWIHRLVTSSHRFARCLVTNKRFLVRFFLRISADSWMRKLRDGAVELHRDLMLDACQRCIIKCSQYGNEFEVRKSALKVLRQKLTLLFFFAVYMKDNGRVPREVLTSADLIVKLGHLIAQKGNIHAPASFQPKQIADEHVDVRTGRKMIAGALYELVCIILACKMGEWPDNAPLLRFIIKECGQDIGAVIDTRFSTLPQLEYEEVLQRELGAVIGKLEAERAKEEPDEERIQELESFLEQLESRLHEPRSLKEQCRCFILRVCQAGELPALAASAEIPSTLKDYLALGVKVL